MIGTYHYILKIICKLFMFHFEFLWGTYLFNKAKIPKPEKSRGQKSFLWLPHMFMKTTIFKRGYKAIKQPGVRLDPSRMLTCPPVSASLSTEQAVLTHLPFASLLFSRYTLSTSVANKIPLVTQKHLSGIFPHYKPVKPQRALMPLQGTDQELAHHSKTTAQMQGGAKA